VVNISIFFRFTATGVTVGFSRLHSTKEYGIQLKSGCYAAVPTADKLSALKVQGSLRSDKVVFLPLAGDIVNIFNLLKSIFQREACVRGYPVAYF